jgi:hypothetical protein
MFKPRYLSLIAILLFLFTSFSVDAQRRRNKEVEETWPPERSYSRASLGSSLQSVFARHYDFCGFKKMTGRRDYTPPAIDRFLGRRTLRTKVEKADLNGGNLLSYIFTAEETTYPLDRIQYRPDQLLFNESEGINLEPQPREGFDAFLLTKNCSGYLKASLDVGLKPPYAAFASALDRDALRNSTVVALSGSFVSPLAEALSANDVRTTELMAFLWRFYQDHPEYAYGAYYLTQFEGVMVKHLTDAEEIRQTEQSLGMNVDIPLAGSIGGSLERRKVGESKFSGTDWETIVYADFEGPYQRTQLFAQLPTAGDVAAYFYNNPVAQPVDTRYSSLREGGSHEHAVFVDGLPTGLAGLNWQVENLKSGAYREQPALNVSLDGTGLRFTLQGFSSPDLFFPDNTAVFEFLNLSYDLVLPTKNGMPGIRIPYSLSLPISTHPIVEMSDNRFELHRKNNGQYAFQWHLTLNVDDRENPLDADGEFKANKITAGTAEAPLLVRMVSADFDARRSVLNVVLESESNWPLDQIDDRNMQTLSASIEAYFPVKDGYTLCRRPLVTQLAVPMIITP